MTKQQKGPSSFIEWAIGTTTENAIRSINATAAKNQPRSRRDVLRFRVSTDDEAAEDTLCITYPRTSGERARGENVDAGSAIAAAMTSVPADSIKKKKSKKSPVTKMTSTKQVRFEENAPRKSSMKKRKEKKITVVEEEVTTSGSGESDEEESGTDFSSDATIVSPDPVPAPAEKSRKKKKQAKQRSGQESEDTETSDAEGENPHVVCHCSNCIHERRQEHKKQGRNKASKKGARVTFESSNDGDAEDSDSATDVEEVKVQKKPAQANKKDKNKGSNPKAASKKNKAKDSETDDANSSGPEPENNKGRAEKASKGQSGRGGILKKGTYPEGAPYPSQRTPNYIEPVRAEVVLTERVVESPNDPPPNAYYDAEHNVMRVYHGPVWGSNSNQGLYPRKGTSSRPLPIGMPHPSQNPYLGGFNQDHGKGQRGQGQGPDEDNNIMPVTQGMPRNAWSAMCPPPGFPPYDPQFGGPPYWQPPMPPFASAPAGDGAPRAPSSHDKDKAGASNVMPSGVADKTASNDKPASNAGAGSQGNHWGTGSNGNGGGSSAKGGNDNWASFGDQNNDQDNAWGTSANNCNNSWNGGGSNNNNNNNAGWGSQQNNSQNGGNGSNKGDDAWGGSNANKNTGWAGSSWDNNGGKNNITGWATASSANNNEWGNGAGNTNDNGSWGNAGNNGSNSGNANATSNWDADNNGATSSPALGDLLKEPEDNQKVQNWDDNGKKDRKGKGKANQDKANDNASSAADNQGGGAWGVYLQKDDSVAAGDNNIMPMHTVNMPGAWGDPTAAASTGGKADW